MVALVFVSGWLNFVLLSVNCHALLSFTDGLLYPAACRDLIELSMLWFMPSGHAH